MKKKILLVEDEKVLRTILSKALENRGFEVSEAVDGKEALEKAREIRPDVILLDIILPSMYGLDVLREFKRDEELFSIPVIIISNLGDDEEINKAMRLGAEDYLIKAHFTINQIVEKIQQVLASRS